ncbi:MAG: type VI secretion system membrane subunit TssM [Syntrophobacter sp.]
MNVLIDFLRGRFVAETAGMAAIIAVIWYLGPLVSFGQRAPLQPELNRYMAILAVVLIFGTIALFRNIRTKRKSRQLVTQLSAAPVSPERASIEEAQGEELATLRQRFDEAVQQLKTSQTKGKRDSNYLYEMPWYVIIGGPGSGKTTLLLNSGLKFPLSERMGDGPVKGVGGTRDCDWFFAEDAIFLDTAGRYTTQDSYQAVDKAAWGSFLGLLKKCRPRRPINGVLLAMSMSDLIAQTEEERKRHTRDLRQRIMELYEVLGNRFPIYMVFTKCDLVAGFNDFFSELNPEERNQVWGETFAMEGPKQLEKVLVKYEGDFDEVMRRLNNWSLKRIQEERDTNRRGIILCFPQQIAILKPVITTFIREIFGSSRYEKEPFLRGVYFTSGTQEGTPIDRVMGLLASVYGMDRQELPVFRGRPKSFFITRVLKEVIFPEAELAGLDPKLERRRSRLRWAMYTCLALFVLGSASLWTLSYVSNARAIAQVEEKIQQYKKVSTQPATDDASGIKLIVARLDALNSAYDVYKNPSWTMGFGLYQGRKIQAAINDVYEQRLLADLLPEIARRLKYQMLEILQRGESGDSAQLFVLLRTYLMLGTPERMKIPQASTSIKKCWERDFSREPQFQAQLGLHTDRLLKLFHKPIVMDQVLVENARRRLKTVPLGTQLYAHLKSVALSDHSADFRLLEAIPRLNKEVFTTADGQGFESLTIPGLYTAHGYNAYFKKQGVELVKQALEENWVVNQYSEQPANLSLLYDDLQNQYFAEYEILWRNLLANLKIKKPQGIYEIIRVLDYLSGPDTPLRPLLQSVEKNTTFPETKGDSPDGKSKPDSGDQNIAYLMGQSRPAGSLSNPARKLESNFQPLNRLVQTRGSMPPPIEDVLKIINEVRDVMMQITSGASNEEQALRFAKERMQGFGARDTMRKAGLEFARLPEPLQEWLKTLATVGWDQTLEQARTELNALFRSEVAAPYSASLKGRYPLVRNSRNEATMADFCRFFAPRGIMDRFFETNLKAFIDTSGPNWRPVSMDNRGFRLSAEALAQFRIAAKIRDAFFTAGETSPNIQFQLKPITLDPNVASFRINIDGQTDEYAHGPAIASKFQWPGPHPNLGVVLTFMTLDGKVISKVEEGPWAWLKTLDKANIERTGMQEIFKITFQVEGYQVRYELRASSVYNPFNLPELQQFRCPESL